ncbi:MAG: hypothetical protein EPO40_07025 [Myxococcaceae bacterium]|nr:MAG: hypothetical protein EPO40_07025 [Myxococcaceae bacterium]
MLFMAASTAQAQDAGAPSGGPLSRSNTGRFSCRLDVNRRVLVPGATAELELACTGIPSTRNPTGEGAPTVPQVGDLGGGRSLRVQWSSSGSSDATGVGGLTPGFNGNARYSAPLQIPDPPELEVRVRVDLSEGSRVVDSLSLTTSLRLIERSWRLEVDTTHVSRCVGMNALANYELTCRNLGVDLTVRDDLRVESLGPGRCAARIANFGSCDESTVRRGRAVGGNSLSAVTGRVDPVSGQLLLDLDGQRVSTPELTHADRHVDAPRTLPILGATLNLPAQDGASRTFGNLEGGPTGMQVEFRLRRRN